MATQNNSDGTFFLQQPTILTDDNKDDDILAGALIGVISLVGILWYSFVLTGIFRLTKKVPTFVVFFSRGLGDVGFLLNSLWLAIDIIIGPTSLLEQNKIYSIVLLLLSRPVLFHFLFIAIVRSIHARFPGIFLSFFTRKNLVIICCCIWLAVAIEIVVQHIILPSEAFITHNISLYGFYSEDLEYYLASNYAYYLNAMNIVVGVLSLLCYLTCVIELRKSAVRKSREGKILAYCLIDFIIVFTLYALKAVLFSQIRQTIKRIQLFVMIIYTCSYIMSSVLLPIFSHDLWRTMFPRKPVPPSPKETNLLPSVPPDSNKRMIVNLPSQGFNQNDNPPGLALERL